MIYIQNLLKAKPKYGYDRMPHENLIKIENIQGLIKKELRLISIYDETRKFVLFRSFIDSIYLEEPSLSTLISAESTVISNNHESITSNEDSNEADRLAAESQTKKRLFNEYEKFIINQKDDLSKVKHLFNIIEVYLGKKQFFKSFALKVIDYLSGVLIILNKLNQNGTLEQNESALLKVKAYEKRAVAFKRMSNKYDWESVEKVDYLSKSKHDFMHSISHVDDINSNELIDKQNNFVFYYKQAINEQNNEGIVSENVVFNLNKSIELNYSLFEAHYQRLLALYELNDLTRLHFLSPMFKFDQSFPSNNIFLLEFFKSIVRGNRNKKTESKSMNIQLDRTFKVKIKNQKSLKLYIKLVLLNVGFYELNCNNKENLGWLLRNGKLSVREIKSNKDLKEKVYASDLKSMISQIEQQNKNQTQNMQTYCKYFEIFVESAQCYGEAGKEFIKNIGRPTYP